MIVSNKDFVELIKKPKNGKLVITARNHEAIIDAYATGNGFDRIKTNLKRNYVAELHNLIDNEFKAHSKPLLAPFTGSVSTHFKKVYDSLEKRFFDVNFNSDSNNISEFIEYLRTAFLNDLSLSEFSKNWLFLDSLYNPNTRYFVDFESNEIDTLQVDSDSVNISENEPKVKRVTIDCIHDINETNSKTDYIIFFEKQENKRDEIKKYYLIDSEKYAIAEKQGSEWKVVYSELHNFTYCPVTAASSTFNSTKGKEEFKKSVISDSIDDLEFYTQVVNQDKIFFSRNQTPIEFTVNSRCKGTYDSNSGELSCNNGYIQYPVRDENGMLTEDEFGNPNFIRKACPTCERKKREQNKFGRTISIEYEDATRNSDQVGKIKDNFGFVSTDVEMLRFSLEKIKDLVRNIETNIIGRATDSNLTKEAINESQVQLAGESKEQTLASFASNIESKEMFLIDLLGKGRYSDSYAYSKVFLGRKYVFSKASLVKEIKELRDSKASINVIKRKEEELLQADYSYDTDFILLTKLINSVIPFQDVSIESFVEKSEFYLRLVDENTYYFRLYATQLISMLEQDVKSDITLFLLDFENQIDFVKDKFISYLSIINKNSNSNAKNKENNK